MPRSIAHDAFLQTSPIGKALLPAAFLPVACCERFPEIGFGNLPDAPTFSQLANSSIVAVGKASPNEVPAQHGSASGFRVPTVRTIRPFS